MDDGSVGFSVGSFDHIGPAAVAAVAKLNAAGTDIKYTTFLEGTGGDAANAIAVDGAGDAYVAGTTHSVFGRLRTNALLYSTLLGASGSTVGQAVVLDSTNHAYFGRA